MVDNVIAIADYISKSSHRGFNRVWSALGRQITMTHHARQGQLLTTNARSLVTSPISIVQTLTANSLSAKEKTHKDHAPKNVRFMEESV